MVNRIQQSIFCGERQICVLNHLHGKHLREAIFPNWIRILSLTVYYHPPNFFPIRRRWFATRRMKDNNSKQEESQEIQRPTLLRKSIFPDWNTASECSDPAKNKRKAIFSSFHSPLLSIKVFILFTRFGCCALYSVLIIVSAAEARFICCALVTKQSDRSGSHARPLISSHEMVF